MSSRQDEKRRRREERLERERAEAAKSSRQQRLRVVAAAAVGVAAVAVVVALAVAGGGGGDAGSSPTDAADVPDVAIPAKRIGDFDEAVRAAGCQARTFASEGREHLTSESATFDGYKTDPPTSGKHGPAPAEDGVYAAGNSPTKEAAVHSLEHGRVQIQYAPGTSKRVQDQLHVLFNERLKGVEGYHQQLFENPTKMPYAVAAVAWTQTLGCPKMNDKVFDAIRAFRERFVDKGPELIP